MKYESKLPDDKVNAPDEAWWKQLSKLFLSFLLVVALISVGSHFLGHLIAPLVPNAVHKKISQLYFKAMIDKTDDSNPRYVYAANIFYEILDQLEINKDQWELKYIEQKIPAATLPGKIIVISDELFNNICHENALSFILAHEIAHAYFRHPENGVGKIIPKVFLNFFIQIDSMSDLLSTASNLFDLKVSRNLEKQADKMAKNITLERYGHLNQADEFFKNIEDEIGKKSPHEWFSTHPDTQKRIDALKSNSNQEAKLLPNNIALEKCNIYN